MSNSAKRVRAVLSTVTFGLRIQRPGLLAACVLILLSILANPGFGQDVELAPGTGTSQAPQEEAAGPLAVDIESAYLTQRRLLDDYLDAIDRIEGEYGPYATELSDLYLGLGQALLDQGEYEKARDAFHRGVMVLRVNSGPNSPQQTNHLYVIANIETMLGNLETADDILKNIYFINSNYYGEENPEMLPVLERMYQWYIVTRPPDSPIARYADYERNLRIAREMVRISESTGASSDPATALTYRRLGDAHLHMALSEVKRLWNGSVVMWSTAGDTADYDDGMAAYTKYLKALAESEETTPLEFAEALAELGDWYLVFDRMTAAWDAYQRAYNVLTESSQNTDLAERFLGRPRPVHLAHLRPDFLKDAPSELGEINLEISMTVTDVGETRGVKFLNAPETLSEDLLEQIQMQVRRTPFRPAVQEGTPVTTEEFIWEYSNAITPQAGSS